MKPTNTEIQNARQVLEDYGTLDDEYRRVIYADEIAAIRVLIAATEPDPGPPRPDDMGELARLVAVELRELGIRARPGQCTANNSVVMIPHDTLIGELIWFPEFVAGYSASRFNNLTPREIADVIQREETKKAAEWAGDK